MKIISKVVESVLYFYKYYCGNIFFPEGCRAPGSQVSLDCEANKYLFSGFLHLQTVLDFIIVQV